MAAVESADSRPNPDPTVLTTEQLARELVHVRREMEIQRNLYDTKLSCLEDLRAAHLNHLRELFEVESRNVKEHTKDSVNSITKQLEEIGNTANAENRRLDTRIDGVKDSVTASEGQRQGIGIAWGALIAIIGILIGIGSLVAAFLMIGVHR